MRAALRLSRCIDEGNHPSAPTMLAALLRGRPTLDVRVWKRRLKSEGSFLGETWACSCGKSCLGGAAKVVML